MAVRNKNSTMASFLIEAGAKIDAVDDLGSNIIFKATAHPSIEVMQVLVEVGIDCIDIRDKIDRRITPLSLFWYQLVRQSHPWPLWVRPGKEEIEAFEALLQDVRDRTLKTELGKLHAIITMIREGKTLEARGELRQVMKVKTDAIIEREAETFMIIQLQVKEDMLKPAIKSLEEFMEVSRARMEVSPFLEPEVDPW